MMSSSNNSQLRRWVYALLITTAVAGVCGNVVSCKPGFADIDKDPANGCEYKCPVFPPVPETCNGVDDDCDGAIDNGQPGAGVDCSDNCPNGVCLGECKPGTPFKCAIPRAPADCDRSVRVAGR